jgi:hypothetical protein
MRTLWLVVRYVIILVAAWILQWRFAPTWLVGSRAGLQTLLQVIPAAVIALFALAFAALFVIVQQVASVFSSKAPLVLLLDQRLQYIIAKAIILAGAALLLGGQVRDVHQPSASITSAVATLTLAASYLTFSYGRAIQVLGLEYSMPRTFVGRVVASAPSNLARMGSLDLLDILFSLLGQSLRYALRRDDSEGVETAAEGLLELQQRYIKAMSARPPLRFVSYRGRHVSRQLSEQLCRAFTRGIQEALKLSWPEEDLDDLVDGLGQATINAIDAGHQRDAKTLMLGMAQLATTAHQVSEGVWNQLARPASSLAIAERTAERMGSTPLARHALACWAVAVAYPLVHVQTPHPLLEESIGLLGPAPPWDSAIALSRRQIWRRRWANKLQGDTADRLQDMINHAAALHRPEASRPIRRHTI